MDRVWCDDLAPNISHISCCRRHASRRSFCLNVENCAKPLASGRASSHDIRVCEHGTVHRNKANATPELRKCLSSGLLWRWAMFESHVEQNVAESVARCARTLWKPIERIFLPTWLVHSHACFHCELPRKDKSKGGTRMDLLFLDDLQLVTFTRWSRFYCLASSSPQKYAFGKGT